MVLLADGAGSDMHAGALLAVADVLAAAKIPSLRFNYPYRSAGRRAPDRPKVLDAATREAAAELPRRRSKLPPARLVLGGRSMGGRYCSMVVGAARRAGAGARLGDALLSAARPAGPARTSRGGALPLDRCAGPVRERNA